MDNMRAKKNCTGSRRRISVMQSETGEGCSDRAGSTNMLTLTALGLGTTQLLPPSHVNMTFYLHACSRNTVVKIT